MKLKTLFPNLYKPSKGYVFIVTYGRSGSTLMLHFLNQFPGYCIRGENNYVIEGLCNAIERLGDKNFLFRQKDRAHAPEAFVRNAKDIFGTPKDPWFGAELTDQNTFARSIFDVFVREILQPPNGTKVSGFKEIRWANNIKTLHRNLSLISHHFPNSKFIFQMRNAHDVAKSGWWKKQPAEQVHSYIKKANEQFSAYAEGNPSCILVKYEDLTKDESEFKRIAGFLDEDYCSEAAHRVMNEKLFHLKT